MPEWQIRNFPWRLKFVEMMAFRIHIVFWFLLLNFSNSMMGQDIHFSQMDFVPGFLNPAYSGQNSEHQYGIIYRDQGFRVSSFSYKSLGLYGDFQLNLFPRKQDNVGLGFIFLRDEAGTGNIETIEFLLNPSYHYRFGEDEKHQLSFSPQLGFIQRTLGDLDALTFEEELLGGQFTESFLDGTSSYFDQNIGLLYASKISGTQKVEAGFSFHHFNNSIGDFSKLNIDKIKFRQQVHGSYSQELNQRLSINPKIQYQQSEEFRELILQNFLHFKPDPRKQQIISFGIGYRTRDAIQLIAQWEIGQFTIGFAYDNNTSSLSQISDPVAGLELGIKYRRKIDREVPILFIPFVEKKKPSLEFDISILEIGYIPHTPIVYEEWEKEDEPELIVETTPENPFTETSENVFALDKIYYDFDKSFILPESEIELYKLIGFLTARPDIRIELSSHTDSRGDDDYNYALSGRRAESAKRWLIEHGVDPNRIIPKGYGETQLQNDCKNDVPCSAPEHRKNRRTEFRILQN